MSQASNWNIFSDICSLSVVQVC